MKKLIFATLLLLVGCKPNYKVGDCGTLANGVTVHIVKVRELTDSYFTLAVWHFSDKKWYVVEDYFALNVLESFNKTTCPGA